jgi:hypothetical protein
MHWRAPGREQGAGEGSIPARERQARERPHAVQTCTLRRVHDTFEGVCVCMREKEGVYAFAREAGWERKI